mmetsp:Transcript_29696/g.47620  ORF Transcript_29696/g.47620 Transcript_29696/m.47620 type:complete len:184 (-) Transcript_29696:505-1056(-)
MATSSPHKKRLRRINNVLDDGQKEKAEKQGREKEKQIDIGDTSDYDENIEFDRAHLLLGIPSFGSSSTKKVALPQTSTEKEPRFVNSRQYRRIIQRRKWRESNATDLIKHAKERERVEVNARFCVRICSCVARKAFLFSIMYIQLAHHSYYTIRGKVTSTNLVIYMRSDEGEAQEVNFSRRAN